MKKIIKKLIAIAATILACIACYYFGDGFIRENDLIFFWLHLALYIGLLWYIPKLICGKKYVPSQLYLFGMFGGFAWMMYILFKHKTAITLPGEMSANELLLLDSGILMMESMILMLMSDPGGGNDD